MADLGRVTQSGVVDGRPESSRQAAMADLGRVLVAGTRSGVGKTTLTVAVIAALRARGVPVASFKCGPDYIDPMFHRRALGVPAHNLDPFFSEPADLARSVASGGADAVSVIEGVMGYYDGLGATTRASTHDVAQATRTPVILAVDARGQAGSLGAVLRGFTGFREPNGIAGVVLTRVPARLASFFDPVIRDAGLAPLGCLPEEDGVRLPSRRLGLVTADEIVGLEAVIAALASLAEDHVDLDGVLRLARAAPAWSPTTDDAPDGGTSSYPSHDAPSTGASSSPSHDAPGGRASSPTSHDASGAGAWSPPSDDAPDGGSTDQSTPRVRVAVARDQAFCFMYSETLELLERLGADLAFFSPLADTRLPEATAALWLPGGYPENHLAALAANSALRHEVKARIDAGLPTIAECGGFLYLHRDIDGHAMAGVIDATAHATDRLQRFGYATLTAARDNLLCPAGASLVAHEFHYCDSTDPGADFTARKASSGADHPCGHATETLYAGFPHLYLPAAPAAARRFLDRARRHARAAATVTT